jgi:hypothetical protein
MVKLFRGFMSDTGTELLSLAKAAVVKSAVYLFSLVAFGFFCIFVMQISLSVLGYSVLLAVSVLLWLGVIWLSKGTALHTLVWLMLGSSIWFFFFLSATLFSLMVLHPNFISALSVSGFAAAFALVWYLRGFSIRKGGVIEFR